VSQTTSIEWTDVTWNPTHGCSKQSPGCAHCYAESKSRRYNQTPAPWTPANAHRNVLLKPHKLDEPLRDTKAYRGLGAAARAAGKTDGMLVFVNSMSDLFHPEIPDSYIDRVFATMAVASRHTFQILTKQPVRMREYFAARPLPGTMYRPLASSTYFRVGGLAKHLANDRKLDLEEHWDGTWPLPNVWLGVSIENRRYVNRADYLRETPAAVRFISAEPLLGPLVHDAQDDDVETEDGSGWYWADGYEGDALDVDEIDWVIVGGESGPGHRRMWPCWVRDLRDYCTAGGHTAFFFKQWGGARPDSNGRELDGREWSEFPQPAGVPV
jgi:protein gp37